MTTQDIGITTPATPGPLPPPTTGITVTPPKELEQAHRITWERLRILQAEIDEREEIVKELKGQLRMTLGLGEFSVNGEKVFTISPNRRWNEDQARLMLPQEIINQLVVEKLDAAKARQLLSPAWYEACQTEVGDPRVAPATRRNG